MASEWEAEVGSFIAITGASETKATFYVDSCQGDVAAAIDQYYATGGKLADDSTSPGPDELVQQTDEEPSFQGTAKPPGSSKPTAALPKPKAARAKERIMGFGDLGHGDESDEDESNEYYTGGEKSGMVVKGGDGKAGENRKPGVDDYFDMLEKAGAQRGRPEDLQQPSGRSAAFTGSVRRLGDSGEQPVVNSNKNSSNGSEGAGPQVHTITFWRNNVFTVNDGEARDMNDPANRPFLDALGRGEAPRELLGSKPGEAIHVNCMRSNSDYKAPPKNLAFTGRGQTLSSQGSRAKSSQQPQASTSTTREWEGIDPTLPSTSVQLRLADGSRMVAQFNHSHTVADIRRFIAASRPELNSQYSLMTAFPSAALENDAATLEGAGLLNAVVIQKLT